MPKIAVFGAGLVTRPLVRYLLDQPEIELVVATRTVSKAEKMIDGHPRGTAKTLNVEDLAYIFAPLNRSFPDACVLRALPESATLPQSRCGNRR